MRSFSIGLVLLAFLISPATASVARASAPPFGAVDTPVNNATGVTGAIPVTGWALDDVQVARVGVCRAPAAGEGVGLDGRCGSQAQVYVGDAVFIPGARPDVQALYPSYPRNNQAGWGFMVLTNMLPNRGNGAYTFFMWAQDTDGNVTLLDTRTITCDNAHASLPFGTIDRPGQGETISGTAYFNWGWALTPPCAGGGNCPIHKYIPTDFPSLQVYVDGSPVGAPAYGFYRGDIEPLFPETENSRSDRGAVGYRIVDTTAFSNGLHTIAWTATDSAGFIEGLGSRYFIVSNTSAASAGTSGLRAAASRAATVSDADNPAPLPPLNAGLVGRRGWSPDSPWRSYAASASGVVVVHGQELDRFEWQLGAAAGERVRGFMKVGEARQGLPVGSTLDPVTGRFIWAPGVGFIGSYDFVFERTRNGQVVTRQDVQVVLRPKTLGPQVVIDTPGAEATVDQPFSLAGWAATLDGRDGSGIDTIHVWAYPVSGASPVFLGVATQGYSRPDVAAAYGDEFGEAGYELTVQGLGSGDYDLAVFARSGLQGAFLPAAVTRVHIR